MCDKKGPCAWARHAIGVLATGRAFGYYDYKTEKALMKHWSERGLDENFFRKEYQRLMRGDMKKVISR